VEIMNGKDLTDLTELTQEAREIITRLLEGYAIVVEELEKDQTEDHPMGSVAYLLKVQKYTTLHEILYPKDKLRWV
jgi:hypothetical protein